MPAKRKKATAGRVSETLLAPAPPSIAAGAFKARCLELMDVVAETHAEIVITKRGKPVAKLVPVAASLPFRPKRGFGALKGSFEIVGDIVSPAVDLADYTFDEHNIDAR